MTRPTDLFPGKCYFDVKYHDADLLIPEVSTLIFERVELDEQRERSWVFRFADSSPDDEVQLCSYSADQLWQILELPGLVQVLGELSRIPPYASPSAPIASELSETAATSLRTRIAEFLDKSQVRSLSISIQFVNQGLSIGRRDNGGLVMCFFPSPLRDDADRRLIALFGERGTPPSEDYLASKGRTRVLEFVVPSDVHELVMLSQQVLKNIYAIRMDDDLEFAGDA